MSLANGQKVKALETDLEQMSNNFAQQDEAKDDLLRSLQGAVTPGICCNDRSSDDVEE